MNWNGDAEEEDSVDQDSTDGTQDLKVAPQPFVLSTVCDDDVEGEWQNSAHALLQEVIGKEEFENRLKNQFAVSYTRTALGALALTATLEGFD